MNNLLQQKLKERNVFDKFISELKLPLFGIDEGDEPPDFYINLLTGKNHNTEKSISIELTDLIDPRLKKQEAILQKVLKVASFKFKTLYPRTQLQVSVDFENFNLPKKKHEIELFADQIFNLVNRVYMNNYNFRFYINTKSNCEIPGISDISISNRLNHFIWQPYGAYQVPHIDVDWLLQRMNEKQEKIKNYKRNTDLKWLVMVSNYGQKSSSVEFRGLKIPIDEYDFDKIFIFEYMSKKIIKLK